MEELLTGFASIPFLAALILHIEEAVDRAWNLDGWASRIRTWFEGILLALIGYLFQLGMFAELAIPDWWPTWGQGALGFSVVVGFMCALLANLGFDKWSQLKIWLEKIKVRVPVETEKKP